MGVEGRLTIGLERRADGSGHARIVSSRPVGMTRSFAGKSVEDVIRTVPLLFSVCGMAQGTAAVEAAEQALGHDVSMPVRRARRLLVLAETMREHLLRIAADGSRLLGIPTAPETTLQIMRTFDALRRAINPERRALEVGASLPCDLPLIDPAIEAARSVIEDIVTGEPIERFAARTDPDALSAWHGMCATAAQQLVDRVVVCGWTGSGCVETAFLPGVGGSALASRLLDGDDVEAFARRPTWGGAPRETTALSRESETPMVRAFAPNRRHGLLSRLMARIVEVVSVPERMVQIAKDTVPDDFPGADLSASSPKPGRGIACVEAARGRLVHAVEVEDDRIARYAILAPTEWNFHPEGVAARGLAVIASGGDSVREQAHLFVAALDPCVAYDLEVA